MGGGGGGPLGAAGGGGGGCAAMISEAIVSLRRRLRVSEARACKQFASAVACASSSAVGLWRTLDTQSRCCGVVIVSALWPKTEGSKCKMHASPG